MAVNPKNMKIAMGAIGAIGPVAASNQIALPPGAPGANGPAGPAPHFGDIRSTSTGDLEVFTQNGWVQSPLSEAYSAVQPRGLEGQITNGSFSVASMTHAKTLAVETQHGRVTVNYDTGELTLPAGIGRAEGIRDFWLGFQENFKSTNTEKYEREILNLKRELASTKSTAALMKQESEKSASKRVADKVKAKYGNEKFIMVKPEDLIKFIEGA
jgi:hypothetical protein